MRKRPGLPKVYDVMQCQVHFLNENDSVSSAIKTFNKYRISSAPVLSSTNEVVGFLSESKLIPHVAKSMFNDEYELGRVKNIMEKDIQKVSQDVDVFQLLDFFENTKIRHAPVIDTKNHLVGFVSQRDILTSLEDLMDKNIEFKEQLKFPPPRDLTLTERMKIAAG